MEEWILRWLARDRSAADRTGTASGRRTARPGRCAVTGLARPGTTAWCAGSAEALYRVGDAAEAERVASGALADVVEPDLLVDLHWTLAQCRALARPVHRIPHRAGPGAGLPGDLARNRARLLVATARTHRDLGQVEKAGQVAEAALAEATEAGDNWATGWALHVLTHRGHDAGPDG